MTYVDELESDFSVFHRLDIWTVSFARLIRLAPRLAAHSGSLALAMSRDTERTAVPISSPELLSVHLPEASSGDTPPEIVEQRRQQQIAAYYQSRGFQVDGFAEISADEMRSMMNG